MTRPELGTKYTCEGCAERFYDLHRSPATCPKCGVTQAPPKPRMYRPLRAGSDRGAFSRRPLPAAAEEKAEPADDLVVEDIDEAEIPDDDTDIDDDAEVEIEIEIESDDGKAAQ